MRKKRISPIFKISAQRIVDTCEKHGVIKWKDLKEKVNRDRELGARNGEWREWDV